MSRASPESEAIDKLLREGMTLQDLFDSSLLAGQTERSRRLEARGARYPAPLEPASPCRVDVYDCRDPDHKEMIEYFLEIQKLQKQYFLLDVLYSEPCLSYNDDVVNFYFLSWSTNADNEIILCGGAHVIWYKKHRLYYVEVLATQTLKNRAMTKGIGREIIESIIRHGWRSGEVDSIALESVRGATGFYDKMGFLSFEEYGPMYRWFPLKEDARPVDLDWI